MRRALVGIVTGLLVAAAGIPASAAIRGEYLEVRSADVYTASCYANSEVGLVGDQATLAWKITQGEWKGVQLGGLGVVAVVKAKATLGDSFLNPFPAKAVLILDERASAEQRKALEDFAKSEGGRLLANVVRVETAPISLQMGEGVEHGKATLAAGNLARIETRSLCSGDHLCGNEQVYYPPLAKVAHAMPAYTIQDAFGGSGLGVVWNRADRRSAFVGTFAL